VGDRATALSLRAGLKQIRDTKNARSDQIDFSLIQTGIPLD
jgi:hypothetical protein